MRFDNQLAQLVEQAQGDGATFHALVDALDAQIVRLRMHDAATRPWKLKKSSPVFSRAEISDRRIAIRQQFATVSIHGGKTRYEDSCSLCR